MNFALYPIHWLAGGLDDEPFDLRRIPMEIAEGLHIEDVSGRFAEGTFEIFRERMGTERLDNVTNVRYALVHRYRDPAGYPDEHRAEETILKIAACLRLVRPMRQTVLLMRGSVRDDGTFDVTHFELPAPYLVEVPEVQKLFSLRDRDADDLRAYAPEFLRAMNGQFWKFRMAVQFHELGHFQSSDWKARFLLWCSAIESIYTSHNRQHQGSLVATSRIKAFIGDHTSIYGPGDISRSSTV